MTAGARQSVLAALLAAIPVALAVLLAALQADHDQRQRAVVLAIELESRADSTSQQLLIGLEALSALPPEAACSPAGIMEMRRVALAATHLAGLGFAVGNNLVCSSYGDLGAPIDIGAPDYVTARGYVIREDRELDLMPGVRVILLSDPGGFTGFYHPSMVTGVASGSGEVSVGLISASMRRTQMASGPVRFDWTARSLPEPGRTDTFLLDDHVVAVFRSAVWDHFTYTAVPFTDVIAAFRQKLPFFLLFGAAAGVVTFFAARRLMTMRGSMIATLRAAIRREEISVEFQPIVDMASGRWIGCEALARWRLPGGEAVPPDVFIRLAEQHGAITQITKLVLARGVREMAVLLKHDPTFFVTFNVAAADLEGTALVPQLDLLVSEHGLQPSNIHIEITERQSIDGEAPIDSISALRARGFRVGTDDFGIGASNLNYLTRVPLDYIKIDRSLVAHALQDDVQHDIVEMIVRLACTRGIDIIAEGVEVETQRSQLLRYGVRFGQGWLFGRPMPSARFLSGFNEIAARAALDVPARRSEGEGSAAAA